MSSAKPKLWPFGSRAGIFSIPLVLASLLALVSLSRRVLGWPTETSETGIIIGIVALSLVPLLLSLIDMLADRRAVFELQGVKLDFSTAAISASPAISVPTNIGVPGQAVSDSDTEQILSALRRATQHPIVVIDLDDGRAWWETRLLVLLAGGVRMGMPEAIVFLATESGVEHCFQGWATPRALLPLLLRADDRYQLLYSKALAASNQWALIEPQLDYPIVNPHWMQPIAANYGWMAFQDGRLKDVFPEQMLASELGKEVEQQGPKLPLNISIVKLNELFASVLQKQQLDKNWPNEKQVEALLDCRANYLAVTDRGQYRQLMPQVVGLAAIVKSLVNPMR